jgi:hypothetical protein
MQSKPNAPKCIYLAFNGYTAYGPATPDLFITNFGWSSLANIIDTDGTWIGLHGFFKQPIPGIPGLGTWLPYVNFPESKYTANEQEIIFNIVSQKYEIFDVNVTTSESIFESYSILNRYACVITEKPTAQEFNNLKNSTSENTAWPYSYRRLLLSLPNTPLTTVMNPIRRQINVYLEFWEKNGLAINPGLLGGFIYFPYSQPCVVWRTASVQQMVALTDGTLVEQNNQLDINTAYKAGMTAAHEIGHLMGLWHDTENNASPRSAEYYYGHNNWAPIMGSLFSQDAIKTLTQWDKGEFSQNGNPEDDIKIIYDQLDFIKKPRKNMLWPYANNFLNYRDECWPVKEGYNIRILTKSDVVTKDSNKMIEGMIGFPYDFDILKVLLPKGQYSFEIDNTQAVKDGSMLDVSMNILNCHAHQSKEKNNPRCNQDNLPTIYPENADTQCISYNACLPDEYKQFQNEDIDDHFMPVTLNVNLYETSIIYLMIKGDFEETPDTGWSEYGSVGKYELKIKKDGQNNPESFLPSDPIPECHCEEFEVCDRNGKRNAILYVQDDSESGGTNNQSEAHIKEYEIISDGKRKKQKFLVYGPSLAPDAPDPKEDDKFYIFIIDPDTNKCVKQEFVTGFEWEKKDTF